MPDVCPGIRRLGLCGTAVSDEGIGSLAGLSNLAALDLAGTRISDAALGELKRIEGLVHLVLDHTEISDAGLANLHNLSHLKYLSLAGTKVTDAGLRSLRDLRQLERVCLFATEVGKDGIDGLTRALPACVVEGDVRRSVDLLPLIDPTRDAVRGEWCFEADALVSPVDPCSRILFPHSPPEEYGLELTAARRSGDDSLCVGLVAGGRQAILIIDQGWDRGTSLTQIDGRPGHETETARPTRVFTDPQPVRVLVVVRESHIRAACGGRVLVDWRGDFSRLSVNHIWAVPDENSLFVGTFRSSFEISGVRLVPLRAGD